MRVKTKLIHLSRGDENLDVGCINPPIMRASTIVFKDHQTWHKNKKLRKNEKVLTYGARGTSINFQLEKLIANLECGYKAQLLPTGLAALYLVLFSYAQKNSHILITDGVYSPVKDICKLLVEKMDIEIEILKADASDVEEKIKPNTKLILCESPGSILYEIINLPKLCKIAHSYNIPVAIDNTYASGYLLNPLKLGADISIIAATKYLSGHSDVVMGAIITNKKHWEKIDSMSEILGYTTSPDDCYLVLRGMRTLALRLKAHEENADKIVKYLQTRKEIKNIFYPKLLSHPNNEIFKRDFKGANGMISIEFDKKISKKEAIKFADNLKLFSIGASWGGYESLVSHMDIPRDVDDHSQRGQIIRFHIGLEDSKDLIKDLEQAFNKIKY